MTDIIVLGGGFWGRAIAIFAERHGYTVRLVDREFTDGSTSASAAASGLASLAWYKGEWRARAIQAYDTAQLLGMKFNACGSRVVDSLRAKPSREDLGLMLFDPQQVFGLRRVDSFGAIDTVADAREQARWVVIAAGVQTDQILERSGLAPLGVEALWGSAVYFHRRSEDGYLGRPLTIKVGPYNHYTMRDWGMSFNGPVVRLCATQYKDRSRRAEREQAMLEASALWIADNDLGRSVVVAGDAARPILDEPTVKLVAPGVVAATGGGRVGGLLSFWAARETLRLLEGK